MFQAIKEFFQASVMEPEIEQETINVAVAALMIETMVADGMVNDIEKQQLKALLKSYLSLDNEKVERLIQLAESQASQSSDIYHFTHLVNAHFDYKQRCELVRVLWELAYADHKIDKYEEYTIRKISELLYLKHQDFIKAKLIARTQ